MYDFRVWKELSGVGGGSSLQECNIDTRISIAKRAAD
jgi:hypothetical protein